MDDSGFYKESVKVRLWHRRWAQVLEVRNKTGQDLNEAIEEAIIDYCIKHGLPEDDVRLENPFEKIKSMSRMAREEFHE